MSKNVGRVRRPILNPVRPAPSKPAKPILNPIKPPQSKPVARPILNPVPSKPVVRPILNPMMTPPSKAPGHILTPLLTPKLPKSETVEWSSTKKDKKID